MPPRLSTPNLSTATARGHRLHGFDYSSPYFCMVTIKRLPDAPPLSEVADDPAHHWLHPTPLTRPLSAAIRAFHETWHCVEPVTSYTIMPDHIHLLLKILPVEKRLTLPRLVWLLIRALEKACAPFVPRGPEPPPAQPLPPAPSSVSGSAGDRSGGLRLFSLDWHDWIVLRSGQLTAFKRYIFDNPRRRVLRQSHPGNFHRTPGVQFLGHRWDAYGNTALLELPVIEPFRCSRSWRPGGPEWQTALARAARVGPGCAGIGTFMSPCEKACGHAIGLAGGRWIVLSPEGLGPRWHPVDPLERSCAAGKLLFLSPYPPSPRKPGNSTLHARCHEMGSWLPSVL